MAPMPPLAALFLLTLGFGAFLSAPVWAHPTTDSTVGAIIESTVGASAALGTAPSTALSASAAPTAVPWVAIVVLAVVVIALRRWPRPALGIVVGLVLGLLTFENGVHSVHHLDDPGSAASCSVATAMAQVAGTPIDGAAPDSFVQPSYGRLGPDPQPGFKAVSLAIRQGRAPPRAV
jgi:hypothetical protein